MADTITGVIWKWEAKQEDSSTAPEPKDEWFEDFTDEKLLWKAIQNGNLESRMRAEFTFTDPVWYGLWMDSPLNAAQCAVLYKLFSMFIIRDKRLRLRVDAFLEVLQKVSHGHGQMKVTFTPLGHTDFGHRTTFAHCPRCKYLAPAPVWHAFEYHNEISCAVCGTRYVPSETFSSEKDEDIANIVGSVRDYSPRTKQSKLKELWGNLIVMGELLNEIPTIARISYMINIRVRRRPRSIGKSASVFSG